MKRFAATALFLIALGFLGGCGQETGSGTNGETTPGSDPTRPPNPSGSYTYELTDSTGCSTGKHAFRSLEDLCRGLGDDGANHSCALQQRKDYFESRHCPGRFGG